ncbi:MAG: GIY-YIG nuclease family protein [Candidatus Zixiibacteriota bacterium]
MAGATIKIFLVNGDPKRLRTAEISNWSGQALAGPRSEFENLLSREETEKSGVYFLTGVDPDSGRAAVYIGEAESIRGRVKSHLERDFWNQIVFFVSKDENLTKSHIRYLEGRLIGIARDAGRALVVNGNSSSSRLPESDREDMEVFLEKMLQLLPVLGVEHLVPSSGALQIDERDELLICEIKGIQAQGHLTPSGFLVRKGSLAVLEDRPSSQKWPWARKLRDSLRENGLLIEKGTSLVFTRDVEFSSPSAAAAVVHGGHANGLISWKDRQGRTLKEIEHTLDRGHSANGHQE